MTVDNRVGVRGQTDFSVLAKVALVKRRMSVQALAKKLGYSRTAVSLAINHGLFSGVLNDVKKELGI